MSDSKGSDEFDSCYKTSNDRASLNDREHIKITKTEHFCPETMKGFLFININSSTIQRIEDLCSCLSSDPVDELCRHLSKFIGPVM